MTAETAVTPTEELDEIAKVPSGKVTIEGHECEIRRIRTREVFTVMKILTAANQTGQIISSAIDGDEEEELGQELMAGLIVAIPYAEDDFLDLLDRLVEPPADAEAAVEVANELKNPSMETTLNIVQTIIEAEAGELVRLGKQARSWWEITGPKVREQISANSDPDRE